jgi:ABC-type taurine transport system ATPase subunit
MSLLEFSGVWHGALRDATFRLDKGLHVALGTPADGARELVALPAGTGRPRRGRVTLNGAQPHSDPALRRRVGALLAEEQLFPARTLGASLSRTLELRQQDERDVLGALGLDAWASRPLASLSERERRSAALALALATREPALIALYEPLGDVATLARPRVHDRLMALAKGDACVLVVTSSVRDAVALGGTLWLLDRGRLVRSAATALPTEIAPGAPAHFVVRVAEAKRLAARLSDESAVGGVEWDERRLPHELHVRGDDPNDVALAVARAARAEDISIAAIHPVLPPLEVVRAASAGGLQAAYERGYRAMQTRAAHALSARPVYGGAPEHDEGKKGGGA